MYVLCTYSLRIVDSRNRIYVISIMRYLLKMTIHLKNLGRCIIVNILNTIPLYEHILSFNLIDGNKMAHSNNVQADNFTTLHIHYTTRIYKFHIKSCMIVIIELGKYALN